ncbi:MAG: hypothetical protein JOZ25_11940 [Actinobacteria bacterium]|nr:hypothetical protein [Actinomycetota bacterium]
MTVEQAPSTRPRVTLRDRRRYDPRRLTDRRVDAAREWLGRFAPSGGGGGAGVRPADRRNGHERARR